MLFRHDDVEDDPGDSDSAREAPGMHLVMLVVPYGARD